MDFIALVQTLYPQKPRLWLGQLAAHVVVALIALVVIGGATRVMEAGLACPDWPLCYGSFLPGKQMNLQVFLEWFHRLDAFFVGTVLLAQFFLSLSWRSLLPNWLPWAYAALSLLVAFQGFLGAITVLDLLPSVVVVTHLAVALSLVAAMSAITQKLLSPGEMVLPIGLRFVGLLSLLSIIGQSLLGSRVATSWAAQKCINFGESCTILDLHRFTAIPISLFLIAFVVASLSKREVLAHQWQYLLGITCLIFGQILLGYFSVRLGLSEPILVIGHQLVASLLVALLSAFIFKGESKNKSYKSIFLTESTLETCHG